MPRATNKLRDKFPGGMEEALEFLTAQGFRFDYHRAIWILPNRDATQRETDAMDYLWQEWDM